MTDNQKLLAEYARTGSETAFREIVSRYVDLVYSTALRLVGGDTHRAQDVAQTVFVNLAGVARTLPKDVKLGGWLHRDTCFTASTLMRGERRRQFRERRAVEMNALQVSSGADFSLVAPILDEAINELDEADRAAILLRFFEQRDFRSVGQALGGSEDAARMRVNRALEKLESLLKRRNITASSAALAVVLGANAVQAAPAGLAATISTAAALAGTTIATTVTVTKAIAMTLLQKTAIAATIAILAGAGIYEARQASNVREQNITLKQQQAPLIGQIEQLAREQNGLSNRLAALRDDNERLKSNTAELLRLRGEVTGLRRQTKELAGSGAARQQPEKTGAQPFVPAEEFANAGLASPEATVKTLVWAARNKDKETLAKIIDAGKMQEMLTQMMRKMYPNSSNSDFTGASNSFSLNLDKVEADLRGYQILSQQFESTNKAALEIVNYHADGSSDTAPLKLQLVDGEWKLDLIAQLPESIPVTTTTTQPDGIITNIINFKKEQEQTYVPVQENPTNP